MPARLIETSEGYEPAMRGVRPPGGTWVGIAGLDLVRDAGGELLVLEDNLRTPSGFAYAAEARRALLARLDVPRELEPRTLDGLPGLLAGTLRAAAPPDAEDPYAVVLTDGPDNSAAFEHAWAAEQLGAPAGGARRPGAARRRAAPRRPRRRRRLPAHGRRHRRDRGRAPARAADARRHARARQRVRHRHRRRQARARLRGGPRALPPRRGAAAALGADASTSAAPADLERALDELDELVVKPRTGHGGVGVVVCAHAERDGRRAPARGAARAARRSSSRSRASRSPCIRR